MSDTTIQTTCLDNLAKHERLPAGAIELLRASVERARVVAVLDGWAEKRGTLTPAPRKRPKRLGGGYIVFTGKACRGFMGESRDAARAAAARAIEAGEV